MAQRVAILVSLFHQIPKKPVWILFMDWSTTWALAQQ